MRHSLRLSGLSTSSVTLVGKDVEPSEAVVVFLDGCDDGFDARSADHVSAAAGGLEAAAAGEER